MGLDCSSNTSAEETSRQDNTPLNLGKIHIVDFERRVKMFAHPINRGRVTVDQLFKAFEDTQVFENIRNPFSLVHKLLLSPFFRELPLTHYQRVDTQIQSDIYVLSDAGYYSNRHGKQPSFDAHRFNAVKQLGSSQGAMSSVRISQNREQLPPDQMDVFSFQNFQPDGSRNNVTNEMQSAVTFATNENHNFVSGAQQRQTDLISIDALILLALVHCDGTGKEKAEVFLRVVSPEMTQQVPITDKDLRTALHFMISIATILEEMIREMVKNPTMGINWRIYQDKIKKYEPTYEGMLEDFKDNVFGEFSNRASLDHFAQSLAHHSWKYFEMNNLNHLFVITLERCGTTNVLDVSLPQFEQEASTHRYDESMQLVHDQSLIHDQNILVNKSLMMSNYQTPSMMQDDGLETDSKVRTVTEGEKVFQVRKTHETNE